jgi:hypothetical protein
MTRIGSAERLGRERDGLVPIAIPLTASDTSPLAEWGGWRLLVALAAVLLGTAATRFLPHYAIFRIEHSC